MGKNDGPGHGDLADALARLAGLKRAYERYWAGLERPEPVRERDQLRAVYRRLRQDADGQNNVAQSFRVRSAQASFVAFDDLCTRRANDELNDPRKRLRDRRPLPAAAKASTAATRATAAPAGDGRSAGPPLPADRGSAKQSPDLTSLYQELVVALAARGQAAPEPSAWQAKVAQHLAEAQSRAPNASLAAKLRVHSDGRVQLVVVERD